LFFPTGLFVLDICSLFSAQARYSKHDVSTVIKQDRLKQLRTYRRQNEIGPKWALSFRALFAKLFTITALEWSSRWRNMVQKYLHPKRRSAPFLFQWLKVTLPNIENIKPKSLLIIYLFIINIYKLHKLHSMCFEFIPFSNFIDG